MKTPLANDLFVRIEFRSHYRTDTLMRMPPSIPTFELEEIAGSADGCYLNHKSIRIERVSDGLERVAGFIATRGDYFVGAMIQVGKRGFRKQTIAEVYCRCDSAGRHSYGLIVGVHAVSPERVEEMANEHRALKLLRARKRGEQIADRDEVRLDMAIEMGLAS